MIFFKSCPRCSGDRAMENDYYGNYVLCLHCGYVTYPPVADKPEPRRRRHMSASGRERRLGVAQALVTSLRTSERTPVPIPNP